MAEALGKGAFSAKTFPCDAPLHTPLMAEVEQELRGIAAAYRYGEPLFPVLNHLDQHPLAPADMAEFIVRELMLPVYWEQTWLALKHTRITRFSRRERETASKSTTAG